VAKLQDQNLVGQGYTSGRGVGDVIGILGKNLRYWRERRGLDVAELAEKSGLSRTYIYEIENGVKTNPALDKLGSLALALNIAIADLFDQRHQTHRESVVVVEDILSATEIIFKGKKFSEKQMKFFKGFVDHMMHDYTFWDLANIELWGE